jgi:hypothetical protein
MALRSRRAPKTGKGEVWWWKSANGSELLDKVEKDAWLRSNVERHTTRIWHFHSTCPSSCSINFVYPIPSSTTCTICNYNVILYRLGQLFNINETTKVPLRCHMSCCFVMNGKGNPWVFLLYPYPYPSKPLPLRGVRGFGG